MPTRFSCRIAGKSVAIASRRLDRSLGIFFDRLIFSRKNISYGSCKESLRANSARDASKKSKVKTATRKTRGGQAERRRDETNDRLGGAAVDVEGPLERGASDWFVVTRP